MIIATMASLSTREKLLERAVHSLLPQVDALCVYLNGYKGVPRFLQQRKVMYAILSDDAGWRGAEAKLWFWDRQAFAAAPEWHDDDIALTCDDDIIYPPNYAERHYVALQKRPGTVSCVHSSIIVEPFELYGRDRMICRMREPLSAATRVHIPGTGTMAFRRGDLDVNLRRDIRWSHCVDIMMALATKQQGRECWALARPRNWLQPLPLPPKGAGIYRIRTGVGNDEAETDAIKSARPWDVLPVVPEFRPGYARP